MFDKYVNYKSTLVERYSPYKMLYNMLGAWSLEIHRGTGEYTPDAAYMDIIGYLIFASDIDTVKDFNRAISAWDEFGDCDAELAEWYKAAMANAKVGANIPRQIQLNVYIASIKLANKIISTIQSAPGSNLPGSVEFSNKRRK